MSGSNINPLRDGYVGGLDHFGVVVDDIDTVLAARARKIPAGQYRQAALDAAVRELFSGHDPDGNVFDLAQKDEGDKLVGVYAEQAAAGWSQDRYLNKFAIRTMNPEKCADFYQYVFELKPVNRNGGAAAII